MRISIIGAGNVARNLAIQLHRKGHQIIQICNRTHSKAKLIANKVNAKAIAQLSGLDSNVDLLIISIADDAIKKVVETIAKDDKKFNCIAHTSGSTSSQILKKLGRSYGVFYPLQTFKKIIKADWETIPLLYTGSNKKSKKLLQTLANDISNLVAEQNDEQRKALHLSAVIMNNFINHLFCLNNDWISKNKSVFKYLIPLIQKTIDNALSNNPCKLQTGPARRGDVKIIDRHLKELESFEALQNIYATFSESIQNKYK